MFLQIATFIFVLSWIGTPWQNSFWLGSLATIFFLCMLLFSIAPTLFREWGNFKKGRLIFAIAQILSVILVITPIPFDDIIAIVIQLIMLFLPLTFQKKFAFGMILFILWFAAIPLLKLIINIETGTALPDGLNNLHSVSFISWAVFAIFIIALGRSIYHFFKNKPTFDMYNGANYDISYILNLSAMSHSTLKQTLFEDIKDVQFEAIKNLEQLYDELIEKFHPEKLKERGKEAAKQVVNAGIDSGIDGMKEQAFNIRDQIIEEIYDDFSPDKMKKLFQTQAGNVIKNSLDKKYGGAARLLLANTNEVNQILKALEKKTVIIVAIASAVLFTVAVIVDKFLL